MRPGGRDKGNCGRLIRKGKVGGVLAGPSFVGETHREVNGRGEGA